MTREETARIIQYIINTGNRFADIDRCKTDAEKTAKLTSIVTVWADMFRDYDFKDITVATKTAVMMNDAGFAPSVGKILSYLHIADEYTGLNEEQAWDLVFNAMLKGGNKEQFDKLPDTVQKAAGSPTQLRAWAIADLDSLQVIESNFKRVYRSVKESEKKYNRLPRHVQDLIRIAQTDFTAKLEAKTDNLPQIEEKPVETANKIPQWVLKKFNEMKVGN